MIPTGACYTVRNMAQQPSYAVGNVDIPILVIVLASSVGGVGLIIFCALLFMKTRREKNRQ